MSNEVFSNHIGSSSELTVFASIKQSFVPCRTLISYPARLRAHLRMLGALRRIGLEGRRAGVYLGPLDGLRTLQFLRWTLIDNDTRMLLAVNFDRPLEPYLRRIVDVGGPLLDSILCHCEGFEGHSSDQGFHKFMEFATTHQAPVELFAATAPDVSVDDADFFLEADREVRQRTQPADGSPHEPIEEYLANLRMLSPREKTKIVAETNLMSLLDQGLSIIQTLYGISHLNADPDSANRDDLLFYRLLETLTPGFWTGLHGRVDPENKLGIVDPFNMTPVELARLNGAITAATSAPGADQNPMPVSYTHLTLPTKRIV